MLPVVHLADGVGLVVFSRFRTVLLPGSRQHAAIALPVLPFLLAGVCETAADRRSLPCAYLQPTERCWGGAAMATVSWATALRTAATTLLRSCGTPRPASVQRR